VIAGLREIEVLQFSYDRIIAEGVTVIAQAAVKIDRRRAPSVSPTARRSLTIVWCWRPASICDLTRCPAMTRKRLQECRMPGRPVSRPHCCANNSRPWTDGGLVALAVPAGPLRCPPAPYETRQPDRALSETRKPRSKVIILDAKDAIPQQRPVRERLKELYPGMIERVSLSQGGRVTSVDPRHQHHRH